MDQRRYRVPEGGERVRLDAFVAESDPALSRAQVQRLIEEGEVSVNGVAVAKAGQRLHGGDEVVVRILPPRPIELRAQAVSLAVLYEDAHLIAIDKPAGMVVHPAPGHEDGTLVNALLAHCHDLAGIGGELRPGIVHRLDKDTTGVLVVAKDQATHQALVAAFQAKTTVFREYLAIVAPAPRGATGTIRTYYGRHPTDRKRFTSKVSSGKLAVTHWELREPLAGGAALVACRLETGRTHQIRVHMAEHQGALLGDPVYGRRKLAAPLAEVAAKLGRQALHAHRLEIDHPMTGERLRWVSPIPADFQAALEALRP